MAFGARDANKTVTTPAGQIALNVTVVCTAL